MSREYQDKDWLVEHYVEKGLDTEECGELVGVTGETIRRWLDNHGIERRGHRPEDELSLEWRDAEKLREKYWAEGLSTIEIAELWDTDKATIKQWLNRHGIERRTHANGYGDGLGYVNGYTVFREWIDGRHHTVQIHRLVAVAEYGFDAVCGMDIHHENGIKCLNNPGNLEPVSDSEHAKLHYAEREISSDGRFVADGGTAHVRQAVKAERAMADDAQETLGRAGDD